jgi:hypothetical protein
MIFPHFRYGLLAVLLSIPGFAIAESTDFRPEGPNLFATPKEWASTAGSVKAADGVVTLQAKGAVPATFKTGFSAEPNAEYFFSADTLSDHRVVFGLAGLNMACHTQGRPQTVCGLVRSDQNGKLELTVSLRSLKPGSPVSAELKNLTLQKVARPSSVVSKPRDGKTLLVKDGSPQAAIVYPSGSENGKAQAERIRAAIEARTGASLPVVSDVTATEEKAPILKREFRDQNLIIIGRLATNLALWSAYNRFLAAEDGYYPGGDGFVVRTAADVFGNGRNHLILGGSSEGGVQKAVGKFTGILEATAKGKALELPWLLEVELGGGCRAAFEEDNKKWSNAEDPRLPADTSGYGKVARWYANAMGYYWSDLADYRSRAHDYLKQVLADRAQTHQYIIEFFVRTFEMLDESPFFTAEEVNQLDSLVLENFFDFLTVTDLRWMTTFSPPYEAISITNRHQISPWYADLVMARFLDRHLELSGKLKQLVEFRLSEKDAAFRAFAATRNGPSLPGIAASSDYEEFPAIFYRYALENDLYHDFFDSGLARQALSLERFDHTQGRYTEPACTVDMPVFLGALAHLTRDGGYQWLATNIPYTRPAQGSFQSRYVAEVHRYQIGSDLAATEPGPAWAGIQTVAQPEIADQTTERNLSKFPLVSMRGGFHPGDDFLAIAGVNPSLPSGTLAKLTLNGQSVLGTANEGGAGGFSRITTNGASALNLDNYRPGQTEQAGQDTVIRWKAELPGCWALETETPIDSDILWRRAVIRLGNGLYVFSDTFTAQRDGRFLLRVAWHAATNFLEDQGGWKIVTNKATVQFNAAGEGFLPRSTGRSVFVESTRRLKKGASATVWSLVQHKMPKREPWTLTLQNAAQIQIQKGKETPVVLHRGALETSAGKLDADLQVMQPGNISVFGWRETPSSAPVSFAWKEGDATATPLPATTWAPAVTQTLSNPTVSVATSDPAPARVEIADATSLWQRGWTYSGFLKPASLSPNPVSADVVDIGREVGLAEIRSVGNTSGPWVPSALPGEIFYAPGANSGEPPPDAWKPIPGERRSRPGVKSGNYGEIHPMAQVDESIFPKDIRSRFIKGAGAAGWKFFIKDALESRHPVRVQTLRDLPGETEPLILAHTASYPSFPRPQRNDDFSLSLLRPDGKTIAALDIPGPVQSVLVADQAGKGQAQILALKIDGKLEIFSKQGEPLTVADNFQQLVEFDKTNGKPNTRHPAGGHRMPFSMGLWRKNADGASKVVIGRYGNLSFLDEKLNLEGVLVGGPYALSGAIPKGFDFSGDGSDEMLLLERFNMLQIGGKAKPVVRDPGGAKFWPQVYEVEAQKQPENAETLLLAGAPIHAFDVLEKFGGGKPRYVLVIRGNYVGLYDAKSKGWVFSWAPPAPVQAGAVVQETSDRIQVCLATVDGILWNATWDLRRLERPSIDIKPCGWNVNQITASPERDGTAILATAQGLLQRKPDGSFSRIAEGNFRSADFIASTPGKSRVVASDSLGEIISFNETSKP